MQRYMFSRFKPTLFIVVVGVAFTIVTHLLDGTIIQLSSIIKNSFFDVIFEWLTQFRSLVCMLLILPSIFLWENRKREFLLPLWVSFGVAFVIETVLKNIIERRRPFGLDQIFGSLGDFSFPSGHASLAFALAYILAKAYPRLAFFWYLIASGIGFSRLYFELHYLSDVVGGAVIGLATGSIIITLLTPFSRTPSTSVHYEY